MCASTIRAFALESHTCTTEPSQRLSPDAPFPPFVLMPSEAGEVALRSVEFALTPDAIARALVGQKLYAKTRWLVLERLGQYALVQVELTPPVFVEGRKLLFPTIVSARVFATPEETKFIESSHTDVMNPTEMALTARLAKARCAVVRGRGLHIGFVLDANFTYIDIHDTIPPFEPRLYSLFKEALPLIEYAVIGRPIFTYLDKLVAKACTTTVMLPCRTDEVEVEGKTVLYLNENPKIPEELELVGCDLTLRTFKELYPNVKPMFTNLCSRHFDAQAGYHLARCCDVKRGHVLDGRVALVSAYPRIDEIASAVNELLI